ncbi:MAG: MBL fold metallo-hydrolase, partial [Clostridia bacterium]|nr:MBL fold metallo-hydrolase [Clostridia bacterium]
AAIAYSKVGDTYYYTAFDLEDNARTVDFVATEALDDLSETKEGDYQNKVTAYGATLYSPYTATQREIIEGFVSVTLNVPRPTGATLVNCGDGSYMYYVANATADTHTTYAASLVAAGFTQTATNDLEGNIYTTYTKGTQIVTVAYTPNTKELRVIMESAANTSLPSDEEYVALASPVATTLTQIGQLYDDPATEDVDESTATETKNGNNYITSYTSGMGYVIRLEDGSFIIVDGGYNTKTHAANIYNTLVKQNGSEDNIVIAAWIFTHAHDDHVGAFKAFTEDYANKVMVERFIYNFPAEEATTFADTTGHPNYTAIKNAINKYDGAVVTIAHAGQVFDIANAEVNILYTYEMMQPNKELDYYNGCSVVFNVVVEGKTVLFLGDAGGDSLTKDRELTHIKKIYTSETLKADIVQAGHHGIDDLGGILAVEFYNLVDADIMLIPVADRYVKIDDSYVDVYERAAYTQSGDVTEYIAGSAVTVLTLDNGNVSVSTFDNVDAYKNS